MKRKLKSKRLTELTLNATDLNNLKINAILNKCFKFMELRATMQNKYVYYSDVVTILNNIVLNDVTELSIYTYKDHFEVTIMKARKCLNVVIPIHDESNYHNDIVLKTKLNLKLI